MTEIVDVVCKGIVIGYDAIGAEMADVVCKGIVLGVRR
jgi:hypothetical protein